MSRAVVDAELGRTVARGALVNLGFTALLTALGAAQALVVPRLLGPGAMGVYGIAMAGVMIGMTLKSLNLPDKLVQERDVDLHTAYRVAFTLEMALASVFLVVVLAVAPLLARLYHRPELWPLTSVLGLTMFTTALTDLPAAVPFREMRYLRRRVVTSIAPVFGFATTLATALLGLGVWSLAAGTLVGFAASAVTMAVTSPVRPGLMWDGVVARRFLSFGWPLWVSGILGAASGWAAVVTVSATIGVAALGCWTVAQNLASQALQVDGVLSDTLFPVLCNLQGSTDVLRRAFDRMSRLSMLWAAPVGFALVVFAAPGVAAVLGPGWHPAVVLIRAEGAGVIVNSIGYSWDVFLAARGITRPQLTVGLLAAGWICLVVVPLVLLMGLAGGALSIVVLAAGAYTIRQRYLSRLFGPIVLARIVWRELAGAGAAAAVVAGLRAAGWSRPGLGTLVAQVGLYTALTAAALSVASRDVVRDAWVALVRRRTAGRASVPAGQSTPGPARRPPVVPQAWETPRPSAFPLLVAGDPDHRALWVTVRDWPAVGRIDLRTGDAVWARTAPYPHAPTPDGTGGCWTALTRSSALAHVRADGGVDALVDLPRSRELLVTAATPEAVWLADAGARCLVMVDRASLTPRRLDLPEPFLRPDYVAVDGRGGVWVGDTRAPVLGHVRRGAATAAAVPVPHPTRFVLPHGDRLWLGASDRPVATLVDGAGGVDHHVDLPAVPFGMAVADDGSLLVALKDADAVAVVAGGAVRHLVPTGPSTMPLGVAVVGGRTFATLALASRVVELTPPGSGPEPGEGLGQPERARPLAEPGLDATAPGVPHPLELLRWQRQDPLEAVGQPDRVVARDEDAAVGVHHLRNTEVVRRDDG